MIQCGRWSCNGSGCRNFPARVQYLYDHPEESGQDELVLKNGRVLDRFSAPFKASGGEYLGRIWFFRDITERRKAEESLRAGEERFRMLIEEAPDAILLFDCDQDRLHRREQGRRTPVRRFAGRNSQARPQHFYTPQQRDARPVAQSYSENNKRALAGEQVTYERRIRQASGEERLCQVTLVRLPSNARLLRASFVDVTERSRAEMALQRLNRTHRTLSAAGAAVVRASTEKNCSTRCAASPWKWAAIAWPGLASSNMTRRRRCGRWRRAGEHPELVERRTSPGRTTRGDEVRLGPRSGPAKCRSIRTSRPIRHGALARGDAQIRSQIEHRAAAQDAIGSVRHPHILRGGTGRLWSGGGRAADGSWPPISPMEFALSAIMPGAETALLTLQENLKRPFRRSPPRSKCATPTPPAISVVWPNLQQRLRARLV